MTEMEDYERERAAKKYEQRRERFALGCLRAIIIREQGSKLTDWKEIAKEAVQAADALDDVLYPDSGQILPDYEG